MSSAPPSARDTVIAASPGGELLAAETGARGGDLRPQVVANALMGLQRALVDYARGRVGAGEDLGGLAADVRKLTAEAFALLEHGLAGYAVRA